MCNITSGMNYRSVVKIKVFQEGKLELFQSKFKTMASIKGFTEALEPGFESQLPDKENDALTDRDEDKEKAKKENQECSCCPLFESFVQKRRTTWLHLRCENHQLAQRNVLQGLQHFGK